MGKILDKIIEVFLKVMLIALVPCFMLMIISIFKVGINYHDTKNFLFLIGVYIVIFLVLFFVIYKKSVKKSKLFYLCIILLFINLAYRFINMDIASGDYTTFLSNWVETYRGLSLKECFASKVGNYSPPYNYFLILISRIPLNDLYLIKLLSFVFEMLSAYFITSIIAMIKKSKFNPLIFVVILFIPDLLINSVVWAQCDSIHTFFSLMAIYFACKNNSKMSFISFGLGLCFKFQSIILFPVALVLLLKRDINGNKILKWKDMWLTPFVFVLLTGVSMLFGKSFNDAFLIYLEQSVTYNRLSSDCANLGFLLNPFNGTTMMYVLFGVLIALTGIALFNILFRYIKRKENLTTYDIVNLSFLVTFFVVLLMPKMLDRYFYLSALFLIIILFTTSNVKYICIGLTIYASFIISHASYTAYNNANKPDVLLIAITSVVLKIYASISNLIMGLIIVKENYFLDSKEGNSGLLDKYLKK